MTSPSSHPLGEVEGSTVASSGPSPPHTRVNMVMSVFTNLHRWRLMAVQTAPMVRAGPGC